MKQRWPYLLCPLIGIFPVESNLASESISLDAYEPYCGKGVFCTVNRYSSSTTDFDEVDDVRDFTSEALYAASGTRLNRPLTDAELRGIARNRNKFETFNRLRFGLADSWRMGFFYKYRSLNNSQITQFSAPNTFNDVTLNEYGGTLGFPVRKFSNSEMDIHVGYRRINRKGIVEFLPNVGENIDHFEADGQWEWGEKKKGKRKGKISVLYAYQDISPDIANPSTRDRHIFSAKARYKPNAWEFFGGFALDEEQYGEVQVDKEDFFVGVSYYGKIKTKFQPTIFTSDVDSDASQRNSQYRTNLTFASNKYDKEDKDNGWGWAIPLRHDLAMDGPDSFENFKAGAMLRWKNDNVFGSVQYGYQDFYNIDKTINSIDVNVGLNF